MGRRSCKSPGLRSFSFVLGLQLGCHSAYLGLSSPYILAITEAWLRTPQFQELLKETSSPVPEAQSQPLHPISAARCSTVSPC